MYKLINEPPCVFSGDHIFVCGNGNYALHVPEARPKPTHPSLNAGQMFEGTPEVMLSSIKKMMLLPKNTLVFPGMHACYRVRRAVAR